MFVFAAAEMHCEFPNAHSSAGAISQASLTCLISFITRPQCRPARSCSSPSRPRPRPSPRPPWAAACSFAPPRLVRMRCAFRVVLLRRAGPTAVDVHCAAVQGPVALRADVRRGGVRCGKGGGAFRRMFCPTVGRAPGHGRAACPPILPRPCRRASGWSAIRTRTAEPVRSTMHVEACRHFLSGWKTWASRHAHTHTQAPFESMF